MPATLKDHLIRLAVGAAVAFVAFCAIVLCGAGCASTPKQAGEKATLDAAKAHATEAANLRGNLQNASDEADNIIRKLKQ